ncbi:Homeobox domain-containing protein [Scedosporium apiospermum]|uniref:Homeobox domain-containing protein n=1 Tax=Pseudallescheria apiosperma TaxID=563466 RepID=A0A084GA10_PSEDA|nr:Homeobox domain-containing protein [Scedosporium apiospermum]KEZ44172.1 Homeobox domain-containing protein [Scedosporium apiospermum]
MASTDTTPSSSFEFTAGHTMAAESGQTTPYNATPSRAVGELTVVKVDPQKHPKNKRKRTQYGPLPAGDKAILEAAYQENPKPDKIARLEIVKRVSLNEKEVQIWFQNRRQNDRRKSRPLTPQEIAALRCGGIQIISELSLTKSTVLPENPYSPIPGAAVIPSNHASPVLSQASGSPQLHAHQVGSDGNQSPHADSEVKGMEIPRALDRTPPPASADGPPAISQSFPGASGFFANRWNSSNSFSTPSALANCASEDPAKLDSLAPSSCSSTRSDSNVLPRPSRVRLSFSLEGKAEIVSNETSPPRIQAERPMSALPPLPQVRSRSLQRSHSALPSVTLPPISTLTGTLPPPRLVRGRSRDVNAWELCCDEDAPDDLTKMAENEANGSALAAISLLRSSGSILQPSGSKRNAPLSRHSQRSQLSKKPRLSRSHSSISRLSSGRLTEIGKMRDENDEFPEKDVPSKKLKVSMLVSPSGDSDKENWSPDEDGNPRHPFSRVVGRPVPGATHPHDPSKADRHLLEQRAQALLPGSRANTGPLHRRGIKLGDEAVNIFEDGNTRRSRIPEDEVERFMRGDVSPSKKGDADCVAGLLALSQGNWR